MRTVWLSPGERRTLMPYRERLNRLPADVRNALIELERVEPGAIAYALERAA